MEKKTLLYKTIEKLDVTPTMYENAKDKYENMALFLQSHGIQCNIYPQGSFALGTITRPYKNGKDQEYDLDMVCELTKEKLSTDAKRTKWDVGYPLNQSELYSSKELTEYDRCWTLHYAKVDGEIGFSLDVVPAVHEEINNVSRIVSHGISACYANEAIAITDRVSKDSYIWGSSNPKGYGLWFSEINKPFLDTARQEFRRNLYESRGCLQNIIITSHFSCLTRTTV